MADADWALYKQIRGKPLPETIEFCGLAYALTKVFKRDFYAATGLYQRSPASASSGTADGAHAPEQIVFKHYHTERLWFLPLGWLGRWLWRREMRLGQAVADVPGVAHIIGSHGKTGLIREFVPGQNLREYLAEHKVSNQFFPQLRQTLTAIHAHGIAHNDLNKPENILVRNDGSPVLIDFQIAIRTQTKLPILGHISRAVVRYFQRMDRYHILKHHRRHSPDTLTAAEWTESQRRGLLLNLHAWLLRRPYRVVRHAVLRCFLMAPETK